MTDDLYCELQDDIQALASPLFEASEVFVRNRGAFLPHGAFLTAAGEVRLVAAAPPDFETRPVCSEEVLPMLHQGLRQDMERDDVVAVAVCEDVMITPEGEKTSRAMKVLVEHKRGLCVALYVPFRRKRLKGYVFGEILAVGAKPEVSAWGSSQVSES